MSWIPIIPKNTGGGRRKSAPAATLYRSGQLVLTHAAAEMLGTPQRVRVEVSPEQQAIRLFPATPEDAGSFSFNGGGNSSHRLMCKELVKKWPKLIGRYQPHRVARGVELKKETKV